jgi:hypothetical protein
MLTGQLWDWIYSYTFQMIWLFILVLFSYYADIYVGHFFCNTFITFIIHHSEPPEEARLYHMNASDYPCVNIHQSISIKSLALLFLYIQAGTLS